MATITELIAGIEVEREAAIKREQKARKEVEVILAIAQQEGRSALSEEEDARCESLFEAIELSKAQQDGIAKKLARAKAVEAEEADYEARSRKLEEPTRTPTERRTAEFHVGNEPHVYSPDTDPTGQMFLTDVARQAAYNDVRSADRLSRHMQEERVDRAATNRPLSERTSAGVGTGAFTGLVVPQYLLDMIAPAVANLRPFADIANKHPLPAQGMSVNISRITTAASADLQAAELDDVSMTDMDDTLLTANIQTAAGSQLVSRQALERGQGIEDTVLSDIVARMKTVVDYNMLNQATHGLTAVSTDVNFTTSSATAALLYPKIVGAASKVTQGLLGFGRATHAIMHPRRWFWMQAELGSSWPMFGQPSVADRHMGEANAATYNSGSAGVLPCGLEVIMDANVKTDFGTNEDEIYVVPWRECHLWEEAGQPVFIRAEQVSARKLGVLLVAYSYFAYSHERYGSPTSLAHLKLSDTGLVQVAGF